MQTNTEIYHGIKTFIQEQIDKSIVSARSSLRSSGSGSISGNYLLKTGDTITGPIAVNAGVTIDGVDISVLGANAVPLALDVATANAQTGSGHTHAIASSSYPAAAASLLATTAAGLAGVQGLGIGAAGNASYGLYNVSANPSHIASNLLLGTTTAGALSARLHVLSASPQPQLQLSSDASNYGFFAVGSTGVFTIANTGNTPANAHLYLNPGGGSAKVSIGNTVPTPVAKLEVNATTEQFRLLYSSTSYWSNTIDASNNWTMTPFTSTGDLVVAADLGVGGAIPGGQTEQLRVAYDANNYASFAVSSAGALTVNTAGTTATLAHLLLNPGGKTGMNMTGTPASRLEVRDGTGAQMRLSYDAAAYMDWTVNSGGNSTITTYGSDLILDLQPSGGTAGLKFMRPANGYDVNLGTLQKKWLSLYAAELVVENLIAFDTSATMGGRLLITPSTILTSDLLATGALGTIAHTGSNSAAQSTGSASWVVTPSGNGVGDFLIVCLSMQANSTVTAPGGWTQLGAYQDWGTRRTAYFYHFMAGGETTYTFILGTSCAGTWAISGFSNVDTGAPVSALGVQSNTGTTNHAAPSVTAATASDVLVFMLTYNNNTADHTVPGSMTQRTTASYAAGFNTVVVASQQLSASGATGTRTATTTGSHDSIAGQVSLKPTGSATATTLYSKYNNLSVSDVLRFEANGHVEFMNVTAGPSGSGPYTYTVTRNLDGTGANNWYAGDTAVNMGQTGAGFIDAYAWNSAKGSPIEYIFNLGAGANLTQQVGYNLWRSSGVAANDAVYFGMGGGTWANINVYITANAYTTFDGICEYWNGSAWATVVGGVSTFYRDTGAAAATLSSSGELPPPGQLGTLTHTWTAASQTGWAKSTLNGVDAYWVRWRIVSFTGSVSAVAGYRRIMRGSVQYGPTIIGNVRNSSTYNDWSERWALGNLHGLYDYGAVTYGFAAGPASSTWIAVDASNGLRIMNGIASLGQWDASGNIRVGQLANSKSRIELSTAGRVSMYSRSAGGVDTERFYVSVAGDLGLFGNGSNYVTINGSTGVVTVSGVINVTGGNALTTSTNYAGSATPGGPANSITGQGALATLNTVAWSSQITGRPIDNNGLLTAAPTPAGAGLHLGSTLMGFYTGGQWRTYMDNSGNFLFRGAPSASVNVGGLWWNTSTGQLQGGYFAPLAGPAYGTYNVQWYTDAVSGSIYAGTGAVEIGKNGVQVGWGSNIGFGSATTSDNLARLTGQAYYTTNLPGEIPTTQFSIERGAFGANLTPDLQSGTWSFTQATADLTQLGLTGPINVTVGVTYEASTWAQFSTISYTGTPDTQFEIRINWYNSGAGLISSTSAMFYCPSASDVKPRFVKVTGVAPATSVTARIEFRKRGIGSGGTSSHQVAYNRTALITYSLGSYINMKPTTVEIGNLSLLGTLSNTRLGADNTFTSAATAFVSGTWYTAFAANTLAVGAIYIVKVSYNHNGGGAPYLATGVGVFCPTLTNIAATGDPSIAIATSSHAGAAGTISIRAITTTGTVTAGLQFSISSNWPAASTCTVTLYRIV